MGQLTLQSKPANRSASDGISTGEIFEILSNRRRRLVLEYFNRNGNQRSDLRPLVAFVAAEETGTPEEELDSDARKRVYTALRQSHLPKLDDIGVIEYDRLRGEVALNDAAREVQQYLEHVPTNPLRWSFFYLGLTLLGSLMFVFYLIGVFPFDRIATITLAFFILLMFASASIGHTFYSFRQEQSAGRSLDV